MPAEQIARLLNWIHTNIERAPVDSSSALDVLRTKQAECQGHAYLYTAFARSLGIPTRLINGLVYSEQFKGFLYHSWAESFVDGR
jgi:transglutaminase-like putative cysteine protease